MAYSNRYNWSYETNGFILWSNNIRVNSISPGLIIGHVKGTKKRQDKIFKKNYFNKIPYKNCLPENISTSVLFLISNLSENITGHNLIIDNGYSVI